MGPIRAVISCYVNILNFSGRARRAEYWWFFLFLVLAGLALQVAATYAMFRDPAFLAAMQDPGAFQSWIKQNEDIYTTLGIGTVAYILLAWLPQLSVTVRRLHDTDRSGWFIFMPFLASVGAVCAALFVGLGFGEGAAPLLLLIMAVPLMANIWFLVVLCLPGTHGPNRFGPDSVPGRKRRAPDHPAFATQPSDPEERATIEAARRAEIAEYYRKNVAPKARRV